MNHYSSDIIHPKFDEIYGELRVLDSEMNDQSQSMILPQYNSYMWMNNDQSFIWQFRNKRPNWWHRMWYRILLGWRWKNV